MYNVSAPDLDTAEKYESEAIPMRLCSGERLDGQVAELEYEQSAFCMEKGENYPLRNFYSSSEIDYFYFNVDYCK
jgi:hypothetical protein